MARLIRILKKYHARVGDKHPHPDMPGAWFYTYQPGQIPGIGEAPPLPDREIEVSVPLFDKKNKRKPVMVEIMKGGSERKVQDEEIVERSLYDTLIDQKVAVEIGDPAAAGAQVEQTEEAELIIMEKRTGMDLETLDEEYRNRGARTTTEKIAVIAALMDASEQALAAQAAL